MPRLATPEDFQTIANMLVIDNYTRSDRLDRTVYDDDRIDDLTDDLAAALAKRANKKLKAVRS
jgi:hypothetical protein